MNKQIANCCLSVLFCVILAGCGGTKTIFKGNYVFKYEDNQADRVKDPSVNDKFYVYKIKVPFKSKIDDKTDYLIIKADSIVKSSVPVDSISVTPPVAEKIQMDRIIYSTENSVQEFDRYQRSFIYSDYRIALQALGIPLKFRKAMVLDGTNYPAQVESGINIGFAPVIKYNINFFNPVKKMMGKSSNQYSVNAGLLLNLGALDLNAATNAPGLISNRKSPMFTYGIFLTIGINNINFGYAIGWDKIIGEGHSYWVYQDRTWTGIIIGLDIIKP